MGIANEKVLPFPSSLSTQIPPWRSTICFWIANRVLYPGVFGADRQPVNFEQALPIGNGNSTLIGHADDDIFIILLCPTRPDLLCKLDRIL
jgi:hypothetical protein